MPALKYNIGDALHQYALQLQPGQTVFIRSKRGAKKAAFVRHPKNKGTIRSITVMHDNIERCVHIKMLLSPALQTFYTNLEKINDKTPA